jgi:hypothetical protein
MRSRASSFKWEYPLLSPRSSSNFLRLQKKSWVLKLRCEIPFICNIEMWPLAVFFVSSTSNSPFRTTLYCNGLIAGFCVLTAMMVMIEICWGVTTFRLENNYRRFEDCFCFSRKGRRISRPKKTWIFTYIVLHAFSFCLQPLILYYFFHSVFSLMVLFFLKWRIFLFFYTLLAIHFLLCHTPIFTALNTSPAIDMHAYSYWPQLPYFRSYFGVSPFMQFIPLSTFSSILKTDASRSSELLISATPRGAT